MEKLKEFNFLEQLGQGAFSTVFHVKTKKTMDDYALKVIEKSRVMNKKQKKSLQNEIDIQRSLNHPNIIKLLDFFEDDSKFYLLLDYCPGTDLRAAINKTGRFSENSCKEIMKQLVDAVNFLQASGIMHRDLKLANILLHKTKPMITDFGLAVKLDESKGFRETFCGTPNYISPYFLNREIIKKQPYGLSSDIWALGCVFYAMLTGRPPFEGSSIPETFAKTKNMQFSFPEYISPNAKDLISSMLNLDPSCRLTPSQILDHAFFAEYSICEESFYEYSEAPLSCRNSDILTSRGKTSQFSLLSPINTQGLPAFTHEIKNGKIEITSYGWVKIVIGSKLMEISPDGSEIYYRSVKYNLKNLPIHAEKIYRYAEQCLNTIRSKTPKVVVDREDVRFLLMSNDSNFEAEFRNGVKVFYTIGKREFLVRFMGDEEVVAIDDDGRWAKYLKVTIDGLNTTLLSDPYC